MSDSDSDSNSDSNSELSNMSHNMIALVKFHNTDEFKNKSFTNKSILKFSIDYHCNHPFNEEMVYETYCYICDDLGIPKKKSE